MSAVTDQWFDEAKYGRPDHSLISFLTAKWLDCLLEKSYYSLYFFFLYMYTLPKIELVKKTCKNMLFRIDDGNGQYLIKVRSYHEYGVIL